MMPPAVALVHLTLRALSFSWAVSRRAGTVPPDDELGPVDQDPDSVREEACKLVSPNERVCSPPPPPKVSDGSGGGTDLSFLSLLFWLLLIAAVLGLLYLVVRHLDRSGRRSRRRSAKSNNDEDADEIEQHAVAVDRSREPVDWRAEAEEHRRAGRFRDALRCNYRALVGDLARRGLVDEIPGRTTGEERVQLRGVTPAASQRFDQAADLFDSAWYGHVRVDAVDVDRFQALERDVLGATAGRR